MKPVSKKARGQGLFIWCYECRRQISDKCLGKNRGASGCPNKDRWKYRLVVHVPGTKTKKKPRISNATTEEEALRELMEFRNEVRNGIAASERKHSPTLAEGMERFKQYIENKGQFGLGRRRGTNHIKDVLRALERFCKSLEESGKNPHRIQLEDIDDSVSDPYYKYIQNFGKSPSHLISHTSTMRRFFEFMINRGMYNGANFFKTVEIERNIPSPIAVSDEELLQVLNVITYENRWGYAGTQRISCYRPWLINLIKLATFTGCRMEELYEMRWENIKWVDGRMAVISIHNLKVEKILNKPKLRAFAVSPELEGFLVALYSHRTPDIPYIIPTGLKLFSFLKLVTTSFSHFYNIAFPGRKHKTFKQLRKTYVTDSSAKHGYADTHDSDNGTSQVVISHYEDSERKALNAWRNQYKKDKEIQLILNAINELSVENKVCSVCNANVPEEQKLCFVILKDYERIDQVCESCKSKSLSGNEVHSALNISAYSTPLDKI